MPKSTQHRVKTRAAHVKPSSSILKQSARAEPCTESIVSLSLGFEKCCWQIWEFFRSEGLLLTGGLDDRKFQADSRACKVGRDVIAYAPASHGGTGLLGLGVIEAPLQKVSVGEAFVEDPVARKIKNHFAATFTNPDNRSLFKHKCLNTQYKTHALFAATEGTSTGWEFGQKWVSASNFKQWLGTCGQYKKTFWYGSLRVRWHTTVPFENGIKILKVPDGVKDFHLSSLKSVAPRNITREQKLALMKALQDQTGAEPHATDVLSASPIVPAGPVPPALEHEGPCDSEEAGSHSDHLQAFLASLHLEALLPRFTEEQIDMDALRLLTDGDLKSLDIRLGPRRKIQAALQAECS